MLISTSEDVGIGLTSIEHVGTGLTSTVIRTVIRIVVCTASVCTGSPAQPKIWARCRAAHRARLLRSISPGQLTKSTERSLGQEAKT